MSPQTLLKRFYAAFATLDAHTSVTNMWRQQRQIEGYQPPTKLHPHLEEEAARLLENYGNRSSTNNLPYTVQFALSELAVRRAQDLQHNISLPDIETDRAFTTREFASALK